MSASNPEPTPLDMGTNGSHALNRCDSERGEPASTKEMGLPQTDLESRPSASPRASGGLGSDAGRASPNAGHSHSMVAGGLLEMS